MKCRNVEFDEYLYSSEVLADPFGKRERRIACLWIERHGLEFRDVRVATSKRLWEFVPVKGSRFFLIKCVEFNQYLYAASCKKISDGETQARMALLLDKKLDSVDLNDSARWWDLEPVTDTGFFRIRNVRYDEYLYAPGDEALADDGPTWAWAKTKGQRRIAAVAIGWVLDANDQSRWWKLEFVDELQESEYFSL